MTLRYGSALRGVRPPMAYSLPLGAAARPRKERGVGMGALVAQVLEAGSYSSTVARKAEAMPRPPPTAYSLPFAAVTTARSTRAVGIGALVTQAFVAGLYSSTRPLGQTPLAHPPMAYSLPFAPA